MILITADGWTPSLATILHLMWWALWPYLAALPITIGVYRSTLRLLKGKP